MMEYFQDADKGSEKNISSEKSPQDMLNEILEKSSHEQLINFIKKEATHNLYFQNALLSEFGYPIEGDAVKVYAEKVQSAIQLAQDSSGFIDWHSAFQLGFELSDIVYEAEKYLQKNQFSITFHICTAVIENVVTAIENAHDNEDHMGETIQDAFDLLYAMANMELPGDIKLHLSDFCSIHASSGTFANTLWSDSFQNMIDTINAFKN
jgi:hypothetical protein